MLLSVTVEADGRLAIWSPYTANPRLELEPYEAEALARELLLALRVSR